MTRGVVPRYRFPPDADVSAGADATPARDDREACRLALAPRLLFEESDHASADRPRHRLGHEAVAPVGPARVLGSHGSESALRNGADAATGSRPRLADLEVLP
jgi:hypothetical protein